MDVPPPRPAFVNVMPTPINPAPVLIAWPKRLVWTQHQYTVQTWGPGIDTVLVYDYIYFTAHTGNRFELYQINLVPVEPGGPFRYEAFRIDRTTGRHHPVKLQNYTDNEQIVMDEIQAIYEDSIIPR